jgi:hypothetical protein
MPSAHRSYTCLHICGYCRPSGVLNDKLKSTQAHKPLGVYPTWDDLMDHLANFHRFQVVDGKFTGKRRNSLAAEAEALEL